MDGYFHTDNPRTLSWLAAVCAKAAAEGNAVNLITNDGGLKVKVGENWTPVILSTPHLNRDKPVTHETKP